MAAVLVVLGMSACAAPPATVETTRAIPPASGGGEIGAFARAVDAVRDRIVVLDGTHESASTLYLSAPHACATDRARFGFHSPRPLRPASEAERARIFARLVSFMAFQYHRRSPELAQWFVASYGRFDHPDNDRLTYFTRDELNRRFATRIPACTL